MTFCAVGPQVELAAFVEQLRALDGRVQVTEPVTATPSPLARRPLGMHPLMEVAISIGTGLASSALYDLIKLALSRTPGAAAISVAQKPVPQSPPSKPQ
ncbi:MAG: hypothetical protein AMXMBFR58_31650 [Phycisphaerae bacterium]